MADKQTSLPRFEPKLLSNEKAKPPTFSASGPKACTRRAKKGEHDIAQIWIAAHILLPKIIQSVKFKDGIEEAATLQPQSAAASPVRPSPTFGDSSSAMAR